MGVMRKEGMAVAAALVYRVFPDVDSMWRPGAPPLHDLPHSPMNLVAYRIVEAALADKVRLVDLGVSSALRRGERTV